MEKHRHTRPDEEAPGLHGPDYIALVIEWDDLADTVADSLGDLGDRGMTAARPTDMSTSDNDRGWNAVDEASLESFPASDPPAWGSAHAVAEAVPDDLCEEVTSPFTARPRMSRVRRIVLGLAAVAALFSMIEGLRRLRRRRA